MHGIDFDVTRLTAKLAAEVDGEVKTNEPLAPYTSYKIGGPAAVWVAPRTEPAVGRVLGMIRTVGAPLFVLGRGTNLLVSDKGWYGVALYVGENLAGWNFADTEAQVLAGTRLLDFVREAAAKGLAGMELLAGIPGSVGGALRMNAGAFGQEIEAVTTAVNGFQLDGTRFTARRDELDFGYRRVEDLQDVVVTSACFRFTQEDSAKLKSRMDDILTLRSQKQPLNFPSCGSVFKRPAGYYAGALIEEAGLKGEQVGGAQVSRKHAGFILNVANAKAADVYALMKKIEESVLNRFGVRLEREVRLIGEFED